MEIGQAGQRVRCSCGRTSELPTMRALAKLERQGGPATAIPAGKSWGAWQSMVLLGAVLLILGLGQAGFLAATWPARVTGIPDEARIRQETASLKFPEAMGLWMSLREGKYVHLASAAEKNRAEVVAYRQPWLVVDGAAATIGLGLLFGALLLRTRK